jgi:hypothetical protein
MDEQPSLRGAIEEAIQQFCSANGGFGIPTGFVYCVSRIDSDGSNVLTLGGMESQTTAVSMGLTAYLAKSFDAEADQELAAFHWSLSHDDEDED